MKVIFEDEQSLILQNSDGVNFYVSKLAISNPNDTIIATYFYPVLRIWRVVYNLVGKNSVYGIQILETVKNHSILKGN